MPEIMTKDDTVALKDLIKSLRVHGVPEEDLNKIRAYAQRWVETEAMRALFREAGARGGRVKSARKAEAARANGRKGGRPRKAKPDQIIRE